MSTTTPQYCHSCGVALKGDPEWCPQCLSAVVKEEEPESEKPVRRDAYPDPLPKYRYSRTKPSATTFGFWGRVAMTILFCVLPALWLAYSMFPAAIVWAFIAWPLALSSIWKKAPVLPRSPSDEGPP